MKGLFDLSGRRALVTGGGSGLGLAMAGALAAAGAHVILVGRDAERLRQAVATLSPHSAEAAVCDVTSRAQVRALAKEAEAEGGVDILVNNAGIQRRAPIAEVDQESWELMLATHLSAPFYFAQALAAGMRERGAGKIINTLSVMSELGRPTIVPYTAAKGGLRMLTRGLAAELGPDNIQVNGIAPGYFATDMNQSLKDDPAFDGWVRGRTPARRWGEPHELSGAVVFFAGRGSDFVTGQVLFVDGGLTASV